MIVYEPRGRAREYAALAANLYRGCTHGCKYCYAPACLHMNADSFHARVVPRADVLELLRREVGDLRDNTDPVLLCFTCDSYQPIEDELCLTRSVLELFATHGVRFSVLTKGGTRAVRDFDILAATDCEFGTTLLFTDEASRVEWEPGAAPIADRIRAIQAAHEKGIRTTVSVEPIIDPRQTLELIAELHSIVDFWKVGKLNHHPFQRQIDWKRVLCEVTERLEQCHARYYLKRDLVRFKTDEKPLHRAQP